MKKRRLVKAVMEYEDGTVFTVENSEANKLQDYLNEVCTVASIHGMSPFDLKPIEWKETKK